MSEFKTIIDKELHDILTTVANKQNFIQYELLVNPNLTLTEGFLSDFYTGVVKNKENGQVASVAIKKIPKIGGLFTDYKVVFKNEEHFYSKIFPALEKFQDERQVQERFDNIPDYFCGSNELGNEYIAMQNIKELGYSLLDKNNYIDENHLNLVFDTFGKFHALSFAFKDQYLNEYNEVISSLIDVVKNLTEEDPIVQSVENNVLSGWEAFDELQDADIIAKLKNLGNFKRFILSKMKNIGPYNCILHGDCWSNNMLFKYKDSGELDDLKLIDFQLTNESTPARDLIFFFYTGASKADLKKLDTYLKRYYASFSKFAKELGSDPDKLYPWDALKDDWKQFAVVGAFFSIDMWVPKLMNSEDILQLRSIKGNKEEMGKKWEDEMEKVRKTDMFKNISRNIIFHLVEYGFL